MGLRANEIKLNPGESTYAFQISSTSGSDENKFNVKVSLGSVNNIIPNNIIQNGSLNTFSINKDTLTNIILKCNSNGQYINSAQIITSKDPPKPQTPVAFALPSSVEILLGGVYNTNVYQCVKDNISLGGDVQYIKNNQTNSYFPYTIYLIWGTRFLSSY